MTTLEHKRLPHGCLFAGDADASSGASFGVASAGIFDGAVGGAVVSFQYDSSADVVWQGSDSATTAVDSICTCASSADGFMRIYSYDNAGNKFDYDSAYGPQSYVNNKTVGANAHQYDTAGNVTKLKALTTQINPAHQYNNLTWDVSGQLEEVNPDGFPGVHYFKNYDALGRNMEHGVTRYEYDGDHVIADMNGNSVSFSYTWGPGVDNLMSATSYGMGTPHKIYAIRDRLGSIMGYVHETGTVVTRYEYDAWGLPVFEQKSFPAPSRYRWQCREYEVETGLYNFRARWYDPNSGRFISKDPIGLAGGLNLYAFCGNDPVNYRDPYGDLAWFVTGAIGAVVGGIGGGIIAWSQGGSIWEGAAVGAVAGGIIGASFGTATPLAVKIAGGAAIASPIAHRAQQAAPVVQRAATIAPRVQKAATALNDVAAKTTAKCQTGLVKVIGRIKDTAVAKDWAGHEVLNLQKWSIEVNEAWINQGIANGQKFYIASPTTPNNMVQTAGDFAGQATIFAREIQMLLNAGYTRVGDYFVPAIQ